MLGSVVGTREGKVLGIGKAERLGEAFGEVVGDADVDCACQAVGGEVFDNVFDIVGGLVGRDVGGLVGRDVGGLVGRDVGGLVGRDVGVSDRSSTFGSPAAVIFHKEAIPFTVAWKTSSFSKITKLDGLEFARKVPNCEVSVPR